MSEEVLSGAAAEHSGTRSRGQGLEQRRSRSRSRDRESIVKESIRGGTETDETLLGSVDRNEQPEQSVVPADGGTIYVANLDHVTTHESLAMAFAQDIGPVANAIVMMEPHTNTSRGFGFVTFTTTADFDKAITSQGQMMVDGRVVKISNANRAQPYEKTPGKCEFICALLICRSVYCWHLFLYHDVFLDTVICKFLLLLCCSYGWEKSSRPRWSGRTWRQTQWWEE